MGTTPDAVGREFYGSGGPTSSALVCPPALESPRPVLGQQLPGLGLGDGLREQVTLAVFEAQGVDRDGLLAGLDALGDQVHAQRMPQRADGAQDLAAAGIFGDRG